MFFKFITRQTTSGPGEPGSCLGTQLFRAVVARERLRCDRNGRPIAIVTFRFAEDSPDNRAQLVQLSKTLARRIRAVDVLGWAALDELAVLLADTSNAGAERFADDVLRDADSLRGRLRRKIYVYPTDSQPSEDDDCAESPGKEQFGPAEAEPMQGLLAQPMTASKRLTDIVGATFGLLVTCPVLLLAALAIKLTSKGPVLFQQRRTGLGGRPFTMYKLRTMRVDAERLQAELRKQSHQDGPAFKMVDDPRLTTVGRFLRRTSIDELPQFVNVLKGDMSLVGPRPLPCPESAACAVWQQRRLDVTPGLTCLWQVKGRSAVKFDDWIRMDLQYIRKRSLLYDLWLLLLTAPAVLMRRGAH